MIEREIQRRVQEQVATRLVAEVVVEDAKTTINKSRLFRGESLTEGLAHNSKEIPAESRHTTQTWYSWVVAAIVAVVVAAVLVVVLVLFALPSTRAGDDTMAQVDKSWPPDDTVIAYVPQTLCFERVPFLGRSLLDECRPMERGSGFMNRVAASRLWKFRSADLSIANGGEIQADAQSGNLTVGDAKELLPFENSLVIVQIQGSGIRTVLERSLQRLVDNFLLLERQNSTEKIKGGPYPYGAGIRFAVNMDNAFPHRLSNVEVNTELFTTNSTWRPMNETRVYSVVVNSFIAGGGNGYYELERLPFDKKNDTGLHATLVFVEYCQEHYPNAPLVAPPLQEYSTQSFVNNVYDWNHE